MLIGISIGHLKDIIRWVAGVKVPSHHFVLFVLWVWVLHLIADVFKACLVGGLEDDIGGNVEDLEKMVWCLVDDEVKSGEWLWSFAVWSVGVHTCPEVFVGDGHVLEVHQEDVPVFFDLFAALAQDLH